MSDTSSLSEDERDFIQKLLIKPALGQPLQAPRFRVDGGDQANALLSRLAENSQLSLEAHFDDHWLSIPLQLVEDEFHTLHLQLGAPHMFENGPTQRPWRLHLPQPILLEDQHGEPSTLSVRELSPSGLLVSSPSKAPLHFTLWLPLPGEDSIPLRGKRVRTVGKNLTAYVLEGCNEHNIERIRHFIFQQHQPDDEYLSSPPQD